MSDKELRKAFEEVTANNVKTAIEYSRATREIVRELEAQINSLDSMMREQAKLLEGFKTQLATIQVKIYSAGTE